MRSSSGNRDAPSARPTDLQFSKVVEPSPRPIVNDRYAFDFANAARQAILALSIVLLVGLALLATSQATP
ncbi:MAG: hypothetical protein ACR2QO_20330 [Acidimicrobiales bacterium]